MKNLIRVLLSVSLGFSQVTWGQTVGKNAEFNSVSGADYYTNFVINESAKKNTANTVTSNATVARGTTNKIDNVASFTVDASAQNGYVEFTLSSIYGPADSGNCEFKGRFVGDGSLYRAQITDGTGVLLNQTPVLGNVSTWRDFSVTYPCGSTRKVRITQTESGTAPAISVGKLYYGEITSLAGGVPSYLYAIGQVYHYAGSTCPVGALTADGSSKATADYPDLFKAIGYTHGGSGANFNLPDLRGIFIRGTGTSASIGGETYSGAALGTKQADATSKNGLTASSTQPAHAHGPLTYFNAAPGGTSVVGISNTSTSTVDVTTSVAPVITTTIGTGDSETRPANISLLGCIQATNPQPQAAVRQSEAADLLGTVFYHAGATCPANSVPATNAAISRTTYAPLFAKIGTTHGAGDGSTTFNVPDLRGVFIRGTGTSASIGGETYSGGALGAKQADATAKNGLTATSSQDSHQHSLYGGGGGIQGIGTGSTPAMGATVANGSYVGQIGSAQPNVYTTINTGDSETRPANISLTPCIWTVSNPATMLVGSVVADTNVKAEKASGITTVDYGTTSVTLAVISNISSVTTPSSCQYSRIGSTVNAVCPVTFACTAGSGNLTAFTVTPPIATTQGTTIRGTFGTIIPSESGWVTSSGNLASVQLRCQSTSSETRYINFMYQVP